MPMGDGCAQPLTSRCPAVGAGHVGGSPGFIDKDEAVRIEVGLALKPSPAPRQDVRAGLLGGMRRLFLRVRRCRWKKRQIVTMPADTSALANSARISFSVMSGFWSRSPRIRAPCASMRRDRRSPPSGPGATDPATRARVHQRTALAALTPKRAAAARRDDPAATAATTRSRRSTDSAFDMPTSPLASRH